MISFIDAGQSNRLRDLIQLLQILLAVNTTGSKLLEVPLLFEKLQLFLDITQFWWLHFKNFLSQPYIFALVVIFVHNGIFSVSTNFIRLVWIYLQNACYTRQTLQWIHMTWWRMWVAIKLKSFRIGRQVPGFLTYLLTGVTKSNILWCFLLSTKIFVFIVLVWKTFLLLLSVLWELIKILSCDSS